MLLNPQEIKQIKTALKKAENIAIIPHKNPDGDAVGSAMGLRLMLNDLGMQAKVVSPNDIPSFLKFLPTSNDFINAENNLELAKKVIANADVIFMVDFNDTARVEELAESINASSALKILIDHHQQPNEFDVMISRTDLPATCEMMYYFMIEMGWEASISPEVATLLMTGILTDTGNFRYSSVKESTFYAAGKLTALGAQAFKIQEYLLDNVSPARYALLSTFLKNMTYLPELRTSVFTLSKKEMEENKYEKGSTDGFVNYGLNIANNVLSVFLSEDVQDGKIKISFRSKGAFDVSAFSRNNFEGGGHRNAAGGKSCLSMEETKDKIIKLLENHKDELKAIKL